MKELTVTYPELLETLDPDIKNVMDNTDDEDKSIIAIEKHCESVFPERFFDILYKNEEIFSKDSINTVFLPNIDFSYLWNTNITENTKESLWKYLQVILFTIVSNIKDQTSFGDTAKLFEAINHEEFKKKLEDTVQEMQKMFMDDLEKETNNGKEDGDNNKKTPFPNMGNLPDPSKLQEHISEMMNGKLGKSAKEIAEETANDMDIDMNNSDSVNDVFQQLFKQPTKLMSLVKNVGSKLDAKMKSGDIKESELLEEANSIIQRMKDMPGMGNMKDLFTKMGMPGKMNMGATESKLRENMRNARQKDRMREKLQKRREEMQRQEQEKLEKERLQQKNQLLQTKGVVDGIETKVFTTGEEYEKSTKKSKKKKKKKKN